MYRWRYIRQVSLYSFLRRKNSSIYSNAKYVFRGGRQSLQIELSILGEICGGCPYHEFPYKAQSPIIIEGKRDVITFACKKDVWDVVDLFEDCKRFDALIPCFYGEGNAWSYARCGQDGYVEEVAEKKQISEYATAGYYYWSKGSDYVKYAKQMIEENSRTNGEFYVALRSALVQDEEAHVFAGGGIVSESHPDKEWDETELKLQPILSALSGGQI